MTPIAIKVYGGCYDGAERFYDPRKLPRVGDEWVLQWTVNPATRYVYLFDGERWVCVKQFFDYGPTVETSSPFGGGA